MPFDPAATLTGRYVRLEPLRAEDAPEILEASQSPDVQRWLRHRPGGSLAAVLEYIEAYRPYVAAGTSILYAIRLGSRRRLVGVTGYHRLSREDGSVEIGGTWLDRVAWRTAINTDAKLTLLGHAFDDGGLHRVSLQTHHGNERSQRAIAALGAVREAEFRDDVRQDDGSWRTSIVYSILRPEWAGVRLRLEARLRGDWDPATVPPSSPATGSPSEGVRVDPPPSWRSAFRTPLALRGLSVELLPLEPRWVPELARAGSDPEVWRWLRIGPARTIAEMQSLVDELLRLQGAGKVLPFVVRSRPLERVVGMFRYLHIDRPNGSVELGTWLDPAVWRTRTNSEVKLLALSHAFDGERFHRVQLRTDLHNLRSQRAIERLGAQREGVLREHVRLRDGRYRSSVCYGLLERDWPAVRERLRSGGGRDLTAPERIAGTASQ